MFLKRILMIAGLAVAACNNPASKAEKNNLPTKADTATAADNTAAAPRLQVEAFAIPAAIEGCSALFALDSPGLQQQQYVYAANYNGTAFVKLNGKLLQLTLQKKASGSAAIKETYTGKGVTLTLTATEQKQAGDEVWLYKGLLKIEANASSIEVPVWGEVGC